MALEMHFVLEKFGSSSSSLSFVSVPLLLPLVSIAGIFFDYLITVVSASVSIPSLIMECLSLPFNALLFSSFMSFYLSI